MSWLPNYDQGRVPADYAAGAGMSVQGRNPIERRNPWADAIAKIAPALMAALKQRRNDAIANQLQNMEQPPRAESVDPSLQGAPATRPFTGGAEGYKAHQMYQQYLEHQQDRQYELGNRQPDTAMDDLQYQHLYRQTHPEEFPQNNAMTAYQREMLRLRQEKENRLSEKQPKGTDIISKQGLSVEDLYTPNLVKFYRLDGDKQTPVSGDEAAKNPDGVFANTPGSKQFIPYDQWQASASSFKQKHKPKVMGQETDASKPVQDNVPILDEARKAIAAGKDPVAVKKRLQEMGVDPAGL